MKPLALVIFGGLFFLGAIYSSAAQVTTIEIAGKVDLFVSSEPSSRPPDTEAIFQVTLSTNAWRYRLDFKVYSVGKGARVVEVAGDGTDIYEVITFDPEVLAESRKSMTTPLPGTMSDQIARVYPGRIPGTATPIELAPWLAFCSRAYFSKDVIDQGLMTNIF